MDIEYIKGDKNIVADKISIFPLNFNQETTQESNYKKWIVSEINDIEEILESTFPITFKLIKKYQRT